MGYSFTIHSNGGAAPFHNKGKKNMNRWWQHRGLWLGLVAAAAAVGVGVYSYNEEQDVPGKGSGEEFVQNHASALTGTTRFGPWTLRCRERRVARSSPSASGVDKQALQETTFPSKLPARMCSAVTTLDKGDTPANAIAAGLTARGPMAPLVLVIRVPRGLVPHATGRSPGNPGAGTAPGAVGAAGNILDFNLAGVHARVPIARCGPEACVAMIRFKPADEERLFNASSLSFAIPGPASHAIRTFDIPRNGMAEAVSALRKAEM